MSAQSLLVEVAGLRRATLGQVDKCMVAYFGRLLFGRLEGTSSVVGVGLGDGLSLDFYCGKRCEV